MLMVASEKPLNRVYCHLINSAVVGSDNHPQVSPIRVNLWETINIMPPGRPPQVYSNRRNLWVITRPSGPSGSVLMVPRRFTRFGETCGWLTGRQFQCTVNDIFSIFRHHHRVQLDLSITVILNLIGFGSQWLQCVRLRWGHQIGPPLVWL